MNNMKSFKNKIYSLVQSKMNDKELIEFFDIFDFELQQLLDKEKHAAYNRGYEAGVIKSYGEYEEEILYMKMSGFNERKLK